MFSLVFLPAALCLWAKKRIIILIHGLPEQHFAELPGFENIGHLGCQLQTPGLDNVVTRDFRSAINF